MRFGTPEHGWLDVEVSTPEWRVSRSVSDVPCDSLAHLVEALLLLATGVRSARVEWSLEPAYWHWSFEVEGHEVLVAVSGSSGQGERARLPLGPTLRVFCRSLLRLRSDPAWSREDASLTWSWPFPSDGLDRLREAVLAT